MKRYLALFALLLLPMLAWGQGNTVTLSGSGAPAGGCAFIMRYIDVVGQVEYACTTSGTWFQVGPGAAGAVSLSSTTNLTGNKQFDSGAFTLVWNTSSNSGTANPFSVTDFATNTGTGYLFTVSSGSSSATKPFRVCYRGTSNCITFDTTTLTGIGTATINANSLNGTALSGLATGVLKNTTTTGVPSIAAYTDIVAMWASGSCSGYLKNDGTCGAGGGGTIPSVTNVLKGDGAGNAADAGFAATAAGIVSLFSTCSGVQYLGADGACHNASGSGTVTVVGSGSLTSTALVTGGGTTTLQTPSATSTLDSSGNMSLAGSLTATSSIAVGTAPTACGSATGCFGATANSTASTQTASQGSIRLDTSVWKLRQVNGAAEYQIATYADTLAAFGAGAIANGSTATTQADSSNDTKVATDAYVDAQNIIVTTGLTAGHGYYVSAANTLTEAGGGISATTPAICVATSTTVCRVRGIYTTTGLTAGAVYYVPTTAAVLTATAPSSTGQFVQRMGVALSTTVLLINPSIDVGTIQ